MRAFVLPLALLAVSCAAATNESSDGNLVVHVNQVALERTGPKSAIVEYSGASTSGQFTVLANGTSVQSGELAALPAFTEWGAGKRYFKADFSALAAKGTYQLVVRVGDRTARSSSFTVLDNALFGTTASALLDYFKANRYTNPADHHIRVYDTDRYVDVWGGWKDAGGDKGKYLSHLSYANFFNPQQTAMVVWALGASHDYASALFREQGLHTRVVEEAFWGADYLHRLLSDDGYFYMTVFDRWAAPGAERMVVAYVGIDGVYTKDYQAAFREGAGVAIAALARASTLRESGAKPGAFSQAQYLQDAERAFAHLQQHNREYCDNGVENIIDDYTALLAATELYRATHKDLYLQAARERAGHLDRRLTSEGWFVSDDKARPYYHAAEAGFPIVSLVQYLGIESDTARAAQTRQTIRRALDYQLALNGKVANPYDYARQPFKVYKDGKLGERAMEGFFIPHANETNYWWQGESARLASLTTAAILGGRAIGADQAGAYRVSPVLAAFAQHQVDWTLGRNPFDICMLYGFGVRNPPSAISAGTHVKGGISNGITGATESEEGRGIVFAPGPDDNNWRWLEQWLPHSTWFLLAVTAMTDNAAVPSPPSVSATAALQADR
jgi:hypothetical protein